MENELIPNHEQDNAPAREIGVITAEIRNIRAQANAMALLYAVEIGRRLKEAKRALPYGEWGEWLKNEIDFSQSTANNMMRLFEEYGSSQISLFGASVDSQTFANLPYSKALQLLAIPSEEREEFAREVHADELSVKELKEAIEERDQAKKVADMQEQIKEELSEKLRAAEEAAREALLKADDAEKYKNLYEEAQKTADDERQKAADLRDKLKKAEKDPKIPKAKLDEIRAEVESKIRADAEAKTKDELEAARKKAEEAEREAQDARSAEEAAKHALEEARNKLKTASPEVAAFKALFDDVQRSAARLREMIEQIRANDPETADRLAAALKAFGEKL